MKIKFFDLVPEIRPPIFHMALVIIIITAIIFSFLPSFFGFGISYLIATTMYCVLAFFLWKRGYGLAKEKGNMEKNYKLALYFHFFPAMCLWYSALIMPFLSEFLEITLGLNLFIFIIVEAIAFFVWLRAIKIFSTEELFAVGSFFQSEGELKKTSIFGYIRHPFMSVAVFVAFSFFSLHPGVYSSLCFGIIFLTAHFWTEREELELIQRFGKEYIDYKKVTGKFVPRPNQIKEFVQLIFWG